VCGLFFFCGGGGGGGGGVIFAGFVSLTFSSYPYLYSRHCQ